MAPSRKEKARATSAHLESTYNSLCTQLQNSMNASTLVPLSPASRAATASALAACASDPYGDGDQSQIPDRSTCEALAAETSNGMELCIRREEFGAPLRAAWTSGLDTFSKLFGGDPKSAFHLSCFMGYADAVGTAIQVAKDQVREGYPDALVHLLETRLSQLRLTPLHYCVLGSKCLRSIDEPYLQQFEHVAELLCLEGARADSRDLVGNTPLGVAVGMKATDASAKLVPILVKCGADPNAQLRFGTPIVTGSVASNNVALFRVLLNSGAELSTAQPQTKSLILMARSSPSLMSVLMEVRREKMLSKEVCGSCGSAGVSKYCASCRVVFYCSRECQVNGWKSGHKEACGEDHGSPVFHDLNIRQDTFVEIPGIPRCGMINPISGVFPNGMMKAKAISTPFIVKMTSMFPMEEFRQQKELEPYLGCVKIEEKNGDFLMLKKNGKGKVSQDRLRRYLDNETHGVGIVYVFARWTAVSGDRKAQQKRPKKVLRLDLAKQLLPPKPIW